MAIKTLDLKRIHKILHQPQGGYSLVPMPVKLKDGYLSTKKEIEIIAHLCRLKKPKKIFEFGTYEGLTTLTLAVNSGNSSKIFTLDLPKQKSIKSVYQIDNSNKKYIYKRNKLVFKNTPYEKKISTLYLDSARLDTKKFKEKMDFIFIDGCHNYEYVKNDTRKAFDMIRKEGIILWHDYAPKIWKENVKFLNELSKTKQLYKIKDSQFIFYQA